MKTKGEPKAGGCMEAAKTWRSCRVVIEIAIPTSSCCAKVLGNVLGEVRSASTLYWERYSISGRKKGCQRRVSPWKVSHNEADGGQCTVTYWWLWALKTLFLCFLFSVGVFGKALSSCLCCHDRTCRTWKPPSATYGPQMPRF
jgi:hypothetical protein